VLAVQHVGQRIDDASGLRLTQWDCVRGVACVSILLCTECEYD